MNDNIHEMKDEEFIEYLERLADDHDSASRPYQAETYREAAYQIKHPRPAKHPQ